jgi:hypothetical protein
VQNRANARDLVIAKQLRGARLYCAYRDAANAAIEMERSGIEMLLIVLRKH